MARSVKVGGVFDRHPIAMPALFLSLAWVPYVVVFLRKTIAFGDLGGPLPIDSAAYWLLFAFQLFVCVISHSLALRTIIRLYAPRWLIFWSLAFFCICPIWGMLTAADVRHPLFAMMVCVLTSSVTFIVYSQKPPKWLWAELAGACLLVCLLRTTGIWCVAATCVALAAFEVGRHVRGDKSAAAMSADDQDERSGMAQDIARPLLVLAVVGALYGLLSYAGLGLPIGQPEFSDAHYETAAAAVADPESISDDQVHANSEAGRVDPARLDADVLIANDVPYRELMENAMFPQLARPVAEFFIWQQALPGFGVIFVMPFYALVFAVFLVIALVRRDWRALLSGMPQIAIVATMLLMPGDATLRFMLPVMAAQIMFFGAIFKGVPAIGMKPKAAQSCADDEASGGEG